MAEALKTIKELAMVAFTLLGVLFGMIIMTFIFTQLGPSAAGLEAGEIGYNQSVFIQNNSLQAIVTYSEGADTQFNTLSITIILVLLIAVFLIFWKIFVSSKGKKGGGSAGSFG